MLAVPPSSEFGGVKSRCAYARHLESHEFPEEDFKSHLFVFSAHEQKALAKVLAKQSTYLAQAGNVGCTELLEDLAYTLACRRTKLPWRTSVVAQSVGELVKKLQHMDPASFVRTSEDKVNRLAFVFGGQGAQWFAMGRELMGFDIFLQSLAKAAQFMREGLGSSFDLLDELLKNEQSSRINQPEVAQPATTAIQIALVDLLTLYYGIFPSSVIGHSSGEIAAAYAMGAITREGAWELAYQRGSCAAQLESVAEKENQYGRMLAVGLSASEAQSYIQRTDKGTVVVACINSPSSVTLSGDGDAILDVQKILQDEKIFNRLLAVNVAYHSQHMMRCAKDYLAAIKHIQPRDPVRGRVLHPHKRGGLVSHRDINLDPSSIQKPFPGSGQPVMYSSVTGETIEWSALTAEYWTANMTSTVLFSDAITKAIRGANGKRPNIIVEIGPHASLQSPIQQTMDTELESRHQPVYHSLLRRGRNAALTTLEVTGALWRQGVNVDMQWVVMRNLQSRRPKLLSDLPNYAWNHDSLHWHESHLSLANRFQVHGRYDLIGRPTADSVPFQPRWRGFFRVSENPWIEDHQVQKTLVYPAAGMAAMAIEGANQLAKGPCSGIELSQFRIDKAMIIPKTAHGLEYALNMSKKDVATDQHQIGEASSSTNTRAAPVTYEFFIYSKPLDAPWQQHGTGLATIHFENVTETQRHFESYLDTRKSCNEVVIPRQLYETLDVVGMNYGPLFQNIAAISKRDQICSYMLRIPDTKSAMPAKFEFDHVVHPATLDSMFQTAFSLGGDSMVPSYIGSIYVSTSPKLPTEAGRELYGYAKAERQSPREAHATFVLSDESWNISDHERVQRPLIYAKDVVFTALGLSLNSSGDEGFLPNHHNLCSELVWQPRDEAVGESKKETGSSSASEQGQTGAEIMGDTALLVPLGMSASLSTLCANLSRLLKCETITLDDVTKGNLPAYCVSLLEIMPEQHFVWQWSQEDFEAFRKLLTSTKGIIWVTRGSQAESSNPKASLIQALARTIHSENPQKRIVTLDMDIATDLADEGAARQIFWVFSQSFATSRVSSTETEYAIRNGEVQVSRLVPLPYLNTVIEEGSEMSQPTPQPIIRQQGKKAKLVLGEVGQPGSLSWDADSGSSVAIGHHDIEVRVISAGIGPLDADVVFGRCHDQAIGTDVFGVVEALGEDVTGLAVGDHVLAVARGSLKDHVRCHYSLVHRVTEDEKDPALVVLPTCLTIADHSLRAFAKLTKGDSILVHSGGSIFGQAAIQMAQKIGAKVFTTVADDEQRGVLRQLYAIPEEHVLDGNSGAFLEAILRFTNGQGVDVIFDPALQYEKFNHQCVAMSKSGSVQNRSNYPCTDRDFTDGHIICFKNGDSIAGPSAGLTEKSSICTMLDLPHLITKKPWVLADSFHRVCSHGWNEWLRTMGPARSYGHSHLSNAFSDSKQGGPLFYLSSDNATQTAIPPNNRQRVRSQLRTYGTYVISGQGGLGIQIAKLLVAHGVKHMALLSRSGAKSKDSQEGIAFAEAQGAHIKVIKVDICDRTAMEAAVEEIQRSMPPVRGLFQCAAAIHDSVFDNMTYEMWQAAVRPKTVGSWNLYELFPRDMDFFIFLSSSAGVIGSRGQANYAAGNAFQDSLARHISTEGIMRAVSIDLGPVLGAGMLADDPRTLDMLKASGFFGIRLQDFIVIVEHAILSCAAGDKMELPPQIVLGVGTGGLIRQNKPADPYWTRTALFSRLNQVDMPPGSDVDVAGGGLVEDSVKHLLTKVSSAEEAQEVIKQGLMHVLAQSMNMKLDNVDDGKSPSAYGVDSLVAVGVRNWVFRECGVNVSVFEVLGDTSIAELSETIVHKGKLGSVQH